MSPPASSPGLAARRLPPDGAAGLRDAAHVVGWGLVLYAIVVLVGAKLQAKAMGSLALQTVIAEWGAGRLAVAWSDPTEDIPTYAAIARRAGRGAGLGLLAAATVVAFALATRALELHTNAPGYGQLAMGLLTAGFLAARDELLLRGVVLRAFRKTCGTPVLLAVCAGAGAAAEYGALGEGGAPLVRLAVAAALAAMFASLWLVDRGGWLPFGAHTAWTLATGTFIHGGLVDLRSAATPWGGADAGLLGSTSALVALVPVVAGSAAWALRSSRR